MSRSRIFRARYHGPPCPALRGTRIFRARYRPPCPALGGRCKSELDRRSRGLSTCRMHARESSGPDNPAFLSCPRVRDAQSTVSRSVRYSHRPGGPGAHRTTRRRQEIHSGGGQIWGSRAVHSVYRRAMTSILAPNRADSGLRAERECAVEETARTPAHSTLLLYAMFSG